MTARRGGCFCLFNSICFWSLYKFSIEFTLNFNKLYTTQYYLWLTVWVFFFSICFIESKIHNIFAAICTYAMKTLTKHYTRHSSYMQMNQHKIWIYFCWAYRYAGYIYIFFLSVWNVILKKSIKVAPSKYPVEYSTALVSVCLIISSINTVLLEALIKLNILTTGLLITIKIATDSISTMGLKKTNFFAGGWNDVSFFWSEIYGSAFWWRLFILWDNENLIPDFRCKATKIFYDY